MNKQFMTEVHPGGGKPHSDLLISSDTREKNFVLKEDILKVNKDLLSRAPKTEIGLVALTEGPFFVKKHFTKQSENGMFVSVSDVIFDPEYFDQEIQHSSAVQACEYSFSDLTEKEMIDYAYNAGFYMTFDLSQVHAICLGAMDNTYSTLNKKGIGYFFPLLSKKGVLMGRINLYDDGFMLYVCKHKNRMNDVRWVKGVLISRLVALLDPTKK